MLEQNNGDSGRSMGMGDVVYVAVVIAFFFLALGYARVAPRL